MERLVYESYHQNSFKNHHDASQKQNQTRYSRINGFVKGKDTKNTIFIPLTINERALGQKEVYLCFIDYTKAFDRVRHDEIITQLTQLKVDGEDLKCDQNHVLGTYSTKSR